MPLRGNNHIFGRLDHPALTIFKRDLQEWLDLEAKMIYSIVNELTGRRGSDMDDFERWAYTVIDKVVKFERIVPDEMHIVIAEGSFGTGRRACTVTDAYKLSSLVRSSLMRRVVKNDINEYIEPDELIHELDETNLEYTLSNYVPAIFKDDIDDWTGRFSEEMAEEAGIVIYDRNYTLDPREVIKGIINEEVDVILKQLDKLNSQYVAIVDTTSDRYGETTCQIITVEEFADRLYRMGYDSALNLYLSWRKGEY